MINKTVIVELSEQRSYPIYIGRDLLLNIDSLSPYIVGEQVCIVTNETVAPLYLQPIQLLLKNYQIDVLVLPDGEKYKSLQTIHGIYDRLLEKKHNRSTTLIALGGGVVGDMTGFAAANYQRGVNFIQIPTTLLSQVDSSVGGKTGVNHPLGKNMIGAFYQPQCVIIDTQVLSTLPQRELSAGMAEIIKYGLVTDYDFYLWIEKNIHSIMAVNESLFVELIARSCQNKAHIVSLDEKEQGLRAILNFGHTFGHAIEAIQGYGSWLHGEAVSVGMLIAAELSALIGNIEYHDVSRLRTLLNDASLPTVLPEDILADQLLQFMALDKKVFAGRLRLVLLKKIGTAIVTDQVSKSKVIQAIENYYP